MIGSLAPVLLGKLPRETFDTLYAEGPDVILAGTFNPTGVATPGRRRVPGHRSVVVRQRLPALPLVHRPLHRGRRPPAADAHDGAAPHRRRDQGHLVGVGPVRHRKPRLRRQRRLRAGRTQLRGLGRAVPRRPAVCGYRSCRSSSLSDRCRGGRHRPRRSGRGHRRWPPGRCRLFSDGTLASNPLFQHQLADADAQLRAARALLYADAETTWATAVAGTPFTPDHRARIRATATWVTRTAASVVDMAYTAGGGSSIYSSSPLQRRLRDIHALTQHFAVKLDTFTTAGAVSRRSRRRPHVPVTSGATTCSAVPVNCDIPPAG